MLDLQLDITDLEDLRSPKNGFMREQFASLAKAHLASGNRVIIKRTYMNDAPDFMRAFTKSHDFDAFWTQLYA